MKVSPEFRRFADTESLAHALAQTVTRQLGDALALKHNASLVVPGGRTPVPFFNQLSQSPLEWNRVQITFTDERWVAVTDVASNEHLLRQHLLRNAAAQAQVVSLRGDAPVQDALAGASAAWQRLALIERPFDAVVLGMGEDGHFASLFPGDAASTRGLDETLLPGCVAVRAPAAPVERVSLNLPALLQTKQLLLLVTGEHKWQLLHQEQNPATSQHLPVHHLLAQRHTPVTVYWSP
ncbi:MAG: 6-phosphogluconolactonase [Pseudomonadota bacterium]